MSHDLTDEQIHNINAVRTAGFILIETLEKHVVDGDESVFTDLDLCAELADRVKAVIESATRTITRIK